MNVHILDSHEILDRIEDAGVVAIIRGTSRDTVLEVAEALKEGGVGAIEVAFNTPKAAAMIETLADEFRDEHELLIGAGTVLDPQTARTAILAGAQFILSPVLDPRTVTLCNWYSVPCIPGVLSPTEIIEALELGCSCVKLFPAGVVGPSYLSSVLAAFSRARIMAVGAVDLRNTALLIKAGARSIGVGGALVDRDTVERGDFALLRQKARRFVDAVKDARHV